MTMVNRTRIDYLDELADQLVASLQLSQELFALVDELTAQVDLGSALTDPTIGSQGRADLARRLLAKQLSKPAVDFVANATGPEWANGRELTTGLRREAIRVVLASTDADQVRRELNIVREIIINHDELRATLASYAASSQAQQTLVQQLIGDKADPVTALLVSRAMRDGEHLQDTLRFYMELASQVLGRVLAYVTVARPLPAYQRAELGEQLRRIYGQSVDTAEHVDPAVLGGVRVEIGDDVIDGTVAVKLAEARRELA